MSMPKIAIATCVFALAIGVGAARAESPHLGKPISQGDLAEWDINILPDGTNLPPGSGKAAEGAKIFAEKCVFCHGDSGQGGRAARLIGGPAKASLDGGKTIANYWPYATTLFDFIRRAMPMDAPATLSDDELYAVSAYVLYMNRIVGLDDPLDADSLPRIRMPNRDGFIGIDAELPASPAIPGHP
jgi:mono/diheme cytochrome c family protein